MKKSITGMLLSLAILLFAGNLQAQTKAFSDESVDFSKYITYSFAGWQEHSDTLFNEVDKKRLQSAFKSEFDARNLSYVESGGDMSISLFLFISEETDIHTYLDHNSSRGYDSTLVGYGPYSASTYIIEDDYETGTLMLDCIDSDEKSLIFHGSKKKTIEEDPDKREKTIPKAVASLMKKFPVKKVKK